MERTESNARIHLGILILIIIVIKCISACTFQLHYNEAYYVSYAQYPALSQFDHPPIVGFLIILTTGFLRYMSEFFIRLGPIILGTSSIYLIYHITKKLVNERAGIIAAYMAAVNFYILVMCGLFILPDAPLLFFSLLSFNFFVNYIFKDPSKARSVDIFLSFLFFGLAVYSKYTGLCLGFGVILYILFFNRKWLTKPHLYIASIIPLIFIGLIVYWNYINGFPTFKFHSTRVDLIPEQIEMKFFTRQLGAQFGLTNPLVFLSIIAGIFYYCKRKFMDKNAFWLTFLCGIPLSLAVFYISLDQGTRPHWAGMSYVFLTVIGAAFLDRLLKNLKIPVIITYIILAVMIYPAGVILWNWYTPNLQGKNVKDTEYGRRGWLKAVYGWEKVAEAYGTFIKEHPQYKNYPLVSYIYRNTSELNYYIARPYNKKVITLGDLREAHKYYWINKKLGELKPHSNALYVAISSKYHRPNETKNLINSYFKKVKLLKKIPIYLHGRLVEYAFIYLMEDFVSPEGLVKSEDKYSS
ncbi:MAG: glycosyltransferase family 39 protein [Victivallales bacterium]|nr:glycosyltransferase family 39 protein [Victivallales bacterium]MCF7888674.1 glycosyltransferase family 39 protein [Victivallales bacterium]